MKRSTFQAISAKYTHNLYSGTLCFFCRLRRQVILQGVSCKVFLFSLQSVSCKVFLAKFFCKEQTLQKNIRPKTLQKKGMGSGTIRELGIHLRNDSFVSGFFCFRQDFFPDLCRLLQGQPRTGVSVLEAWSQQLHFGAA